MLEPSRAPRSTRVVELTVDDDEVVAAAAASGPQSEGRADDTEDVIRRRLEVYAEQTAPLIAVYADAGPARRRSTASARSTRSPARILAALGV